MYKTIVVGKAKETYLERLMKIVKEEQIGDLVEFTGFLEDHEDVYRIAASSKVLAFPSHNDVSPNTIREAMFMKLPIVAYGIGGVPFFNVHNECLCLVDKIEINRFAESLQRVIEDEDYREKLITNAYEEAVNYYTPEKIYQQIIAIYNDILTE